MSDSVQKYSASRMGSAPIGPLLLSCSVPMMISMLVQALYNIVDSIFVSRVNEAALSAVSLAFPIQNLMIAYKERFDKDNFVKNLLLDNLLLIDIYSRAKKLHIQTEVNRVAMIVETDNKDSNILEMLRSFLGVNSLDFITAVDEKNIIIVNMGFFDVVMFNPVIVSKHDMYETEEGCLSLDGVRKTTRYQEIEVEYYDFNWKKQRQKLSGWTAQICQHEIDHLSGKII